MAALDPLIIEKLGLDKLQDPRRNYMSIDDTMEGLDFGGYTPAPQQVIDTSPIESAAPPADSANSPSLTRDDLYGMMMQRYMSQESPDAPLVPSPTTDDVVSTAITGLAPVLLGLLLKGKKGAGIGGVIGGKFADQQVQQRRTEAVKSAELQNTADRERRQVLQTLLQNQNAQSREDRRDERQIRSIEASSDRVIKASEEASERDVRKREAEVSTKNKERLSTYEQANKDLKTLGVNVEPTELDGVVAPLDSKNIKTIREKTASYVPTMKLFDELLTSAKTNDISKNTTLTNQLILQLKSDAINKGGAAFSTLEYILNSAGLLKEPLNLQSANITAETAAAAGQTLAGTDRMQSLIDVAKYYRSRANDEIGAFGGQLVSSYEDKDGKLQPTIWGRLDNFTSNYEKSLRNPTGVQAPTNPLVTFDMNRARQIQQQRQKQAVNKAIDGGTY